MAEQGLKQKTVSGVGWSAIDSVAGQGVSFLIGLILARLLSPEEYGLIGIITIFISVFNTIVDSGFSNAIIRKQHPIDDDYDTVFIFNLVLSAFLFIILFVSAPAIASFFRNAQLIPLTRVMASIVIINSFAIVQRAKLVKSIDFKTQTKVSLTSSIISGIVGISMAYMGMGVWSLVGQQLSRQSLNTAGLWLSGRWCPRFHFSWISFKELFNYGWKLLVSHLITTIWNEISHVVIGRCYSPADLGQYTRAHQFSSIFSTNLTAIVQRVSFPVLSSIQDEKERLKASYRKVITSTMLISFLSMFGLAAMAKPLIVTLLGEKWMPAADYLPILCFNFVLYPLRAINTNMLQVSGRSDQLLILEIIKKTLAIGPLLIGVYISIYWMLWGNVITGIIGFFLNSYFSGKFVHYSTWQQIEDLTPSFLFASCVALAAYMVNVFLPPAWFTLLFQLLVFALVLFVLSHIVKMQALNELTTIVKSAVAGIIK